MLQTRQHSRRAIFRGDLQRWCSLLYASLVEARRARLVAAKIESARKVRRVVFADDQ